jgi:hypothetical protein
MLAEDTRKSRVGFRAGLFYGKEHHVLWSSHLLSTARTSVEDFYQEVAVTEKTPGPIQYWGDADDCDDDCLEFISQVCPDARYIHLDSSSLPGDAASADLRRVLERPMRDGRVLQLDSAAAKRASENDVECDSRIFDWLDLPNADPGRSAS